jgi:hypothetical protein
MSRNYLRDYENGYLIDEGDFSIYDDEEEPEPSTKHQDEYDNNNNLPIGFVDSRLIDAMIKDAHEEYKNIIILENKKATSLQIANDIDKTITDEEYSIFLYNQAKYKHEYNFCDVLKEYMHYINSMFSAKEHFYALIGLPMNPKLIELDKQKHDILI